MNPQELRKFRHNLIQGEFRNALISRERESATDNDGVVVLSAAEFTAPEDGEKLDSLLPENAENIARIKTAIDVALEVAAQRASKPLENLTPDDLRSFAPPLILNGTTQQLPFMSGIVSELSPELRVDLVDCGPKGVGNTKTQFEAMANYLAGQPRKHLVVITSDYHSPRVARTAGKFTNESVTYDVVYVTHNQLPGYDVTERVLGETRRIGAYALKGDIDWHI